MSLTVTRRRSKHYGPRSSNLRFRNRLSATGQWLNWQVDPASQEVEVKGIQTTESENHSWPPRPGGFKGDVGGEFFTRKQSATIKTGNRHLQAQSFSPGNLYDRREYLSDNIFTPVSASAGKAIWPTSLHSSKEELEEKGATAVAQCKPTNASSDLLLAISELFKDGLPLASSSRNWQSRTQSARSAGSEYLNQQFGWKPLVNDVHTFVSTVRKAENIISQYERDAGKLVRRRRNLPSERSTTETILSTAKYPSGALAALSGNIYGTNVPGTWIRKAETLRETWFSGAFSYGVPLGQTNREGSLTLAEKADKLFGVSLTPDVLWELAPWSWVIDWFSNTGDVLSNVSDVASQGLVMQYGYMMEHTVHKWTYSIHGARISGKPCDAPFSSLVTETKQRVKANPFGFGVSWDGLSPFQLSIAAALGISRG